MSAIESEIRQLKQKLESDLPGKYEILTADVEIVQVKFMISNYRILTCVAQMRKNYPNEELLVELKAKYFSPVLIKRLTSLLRVTNINFDQFENKNVSKMIQNLVALTVY